MSHADSCLATIAAAATTISEAAVWACGALWLLLIFKNMGGRSK